MPLAIESKLKLKFIAVFVGCLLLPSCGQGLLYIVDAYGSQIHQEVLVPGTNQLDIKTHGWPTSMHISNVVLGGKPQVSRKWLKVE